MNIKKIKIMTTEEIHNLTKTVKTLTLFKILLALAQSSVQLETVGKKKGKAETRKGSNGRIRKGHQEQICVLRNQG